MCIEVFLDNLLTQFRSLQSDFDHANKNVCLIPIAKTLCEEGP